MQGITVVVIFFLSLWSSMEDSKDLNRFSFYLKRIFDECHRGYFSHLSWSSLVLT